VSDQERFRVAVLIVGFRACVTALAPASTEPSFDIFICESGGSVSFQGLRTALVGPLGPCTAVSKQT
jgi:hypothetical protein